MRMPTKSHPLHATLKRHHTVKTPTGSQVTTAINPALGVHLDNAQADQAQKAARMQDVIPSIATAHMKGAVG